MLGIENIGELLKGKRLIIASNREPYIHKKSKGDVVCVKGPGGLVSALDPVMWSTGGVWVSWGSGEADFTVSDGHGRVMVPPEDPSYTLKRVRLTKRDISNYYYGFSNRVLWPIFNLSLDRARFREDYWRAYKRVNSKFADAILEETEIDDLIWIHDYHLSLVPRLVRNVVDNARIALFWHIPWVPPEIFFNLPWHREILEGLLASDLIGFQTRSYVKNFVDCAEKELNAVYNEGERVLEIADHKIVVMAFPIGIDYDGWANLSRERKTLKRAERLRRRSDTRHIILGVDRLDYSKGILNKLRAFERFLEENPDFRGKVTLIQVASPSRTRVQEYREMKREIDETVGRINGRFQTMDWVPIRYFYRYIPLESLVAYYKIADVALITPLVDGMNLVSKEYIATKNTEGDGVLILSEFAGAAEELNEALIINPHDIEGIAGAVKDALEMPLEKKRERLNTLRNKVKEHNIYWWLRRFLEEWGSIYD